MDEKDFGLEQGLKELKKLIPLSAQQLDEASCKAIADKAESVYEKYSGSEEPALAYAKILFNLSIQQTELNELEASVAKIQSLQERFSDSSIIAEAYAKILVGLSIQQTELQEWEASVAKLQSLQERFSDSPEIAKAYAMALVKLSIQQTELQELEASVAKIQSLQERFSDSPEIAKAYAMALVKLSIQQTELQELEASVAKIQSLQECFSDSPKIAEAYAMALLNLSAQQTELNELEITVAKIQSLQERFSDSPEIAKAYAMALVKLSIQQTELQELEASVAKIQSLQERFSDSPEIAKAYAMALVKLSIQQTELQELEASVAKIQSLQERFSDSPEIAKAYAMALVKLSIQQTEFTELGVAVEKLQALHEHFQKSEIIAFIYGVFLASLFEQQTEIDERLQTIETIKKLYEQFSTFMLQNFDDLFFYYDNVFDSEVYKLFNFILKEGLLKNTKYAILQTRAEHYKEDSDELNNLLSIYQYVQKIKYQLGLKDEDKKENIKFGHYTKGNVLQILLDQDQREESSFSISGKTRLNNANYMNDPEEGIIIEKILGLDRRDALEPSSWFLMSFTIKTDDLAMWSQYGDDAKGVCLVLREDDFSRFSSFNDVSWRREKVSLEFSDKMYLMKSELNIGFEKSAFRSESENSVDTVKDEGTEPNSEEKDSVSKGNVDYLYRIAYVNDSGGKFSIEKTELFNEYEIKKLEEFLEALKEKMDKDLNKGDDFYQKAISDCIEEIRYLFKSIDYKYEDELRILRYANLDSSNEEIKIDKSSGIGKLYVEREHPIQIGEVIFGPKFPNPEYITPLLKLLDKDIAFKKSTIKFR